MFRLFTVLSISPRRPSDANAFKKCIKEPIIDTSYEGPRTLDSNGYCNAKFEQSVSKEVRCQMMFDKCRKIPIIDSSYEGGGQLDNTNYCESEWKKCMSGR